MNPLKSTFLHILKMNISGECYLQIFSFSSEETNYFRLESRTFNFNYILIFAANKSVLFDDFSSLLLMKKRKWQETFHKERWLSFSDNESISNEKTLFQFILRRENNSFFYKKIISEIFEYHSPDFVSVFLAKIC